MCAVGKELNISVRYKGMADGTHKWGIIFRVLRIVFTPATTFSMIWRIMTGANQD
jgi:hypothetical protein